MSLWSIIKGIWKTTAQIDQEDIDDNIKGNTGKIEAAAKNLKPGEDFVEFISGKPVVAKAKVDEKQAGKVAAAKAKGRTTKSKILGEA